MRKILVIDDEEEFVSFIKTNLELRGDYEVVTALSGKDGIGIAERDKPDLVLLDIAMPEMDGFAVLKKLRENENTKSIPVIMVTARTDDEAMMKALKLHDDGYIPKPVKIEEMEEKIEDALGEIEGLDS
jgi:DNA-binding response OmpR family regulator